jgi:Right handed beta helix region/Protein of unknown function (DUF1565)
MTRKQVLLGGIAGAASVGAAAGWARKGAVDTVTPDLGAFQTRRDGATGWGSALPRRLAASAGRTRVIDPVTGSDDNSGSESAPWRTLAKAFAALKPGETALVKTGTYPGHLTPTGRASGTAAAPKTLAAYPGHAPLLTGGIRADGLAYWRFRGLTLAPVDRDTGFWARGASRRLEFDRVVFRDCPLGSGMVAEDTCSDLQWFRCVFRNNGRAHTVRDHGLYLKASHCVVAQSVFAGNSSYGVQLYPSARDNFVVNNTVVGNGFRSADPSWSGGIVIAGRASGGNRIVNNVVAFNRGFAARTDLAAERGSDNVFRRNLVWGNTLRSSGETFWASTGQVTETGTIQADPMFVDRAHGNYRLRAGSPAIGRAVVRFTPAAARRRTRKPGR